MGVADREIMTICSLADSNTCL
jgi:hypothetical protein